jgi:PAS domain S-box-containing protein
MAGWYRVLSLIGGRRVIVALGGLYLALAVWWTVTSAGGTVSIGEVVDFTLIAAPGLAVLYAGYRLPRFDIRDEFEPAVAGWCLGGLVLMVALLGFYSLQPGEGVDDPAAVFILTALGSVAGLAAGIHNGQSKTRAHELEETIDQLATSNERLERHQRYTDEVLDAIDDVFYVLDESGNVRRWNESLREVTGYAPDEIASMHTTDFFGEDDQDAIRAAVRTAFETGSVEVQLDFHTSDGERIPFEFAATTLEDPWGETVLAVIGRDVTGRVDREQRLEELVERLEQSNERLEQFAYAASHDLQEPLRMVSSYLRLIEQRYADELDEDGEEFIDYAVDGADRMRNMIEGLLEYSRVDTRGDPFDPVELDEVLADVCEDLQVRIAESDAEITAGELPRVRGDRGQLRQLFQNLLDNAFEYSGEGPPRIDVSVERDGAGYVFSVRDEGIGIPGSDSERVFEVFQRLHAPDDHSGTGIGLALCERIVERHDGDIWVDSEPGEGATFRFTLPEDASRANGR